MQDPAAVVVPAEQVDGVVETLLSLFSAKAEELGATATAHLKGEADVRSLHACRRELAEIEDALVDADWRRAGHSRGLELHGPPALVRDVVYGALLDAAESVAEVCREYEAGQAQLDDFRSAVEAVSVRFELFSAIEQRDTL